MSTCPYTVGQTIIIQATFKDLDGVLVDPSSVDVTVEAPDGTQTTPTASNVSTGVYQASVGMDQPGWWKWRVVGTTEDGDAVCEDKCCAMPSQIPASSPGSP